MDSKGHIHLDLSPEKLQQLHDQGLDVVQIQEEEMTAKQRESLRVSLKDHTSFLGKKLTEMTRNQRKRRRKARKGKR